MPLLKWKLTHDYCICAWKASTTAHSVHPRDNQTTANLKYLLYIASYLTSLSGVMGIFLFAATNTGHRLRLFISLIPELSPLGNQFVIHHYLSSAREKAQRSPVHTHSQIHAGMERTHKQECTHRLLPKPWRCLCPLWGIKSIMAER